MTSKLQDIRELTDADLDHVSGGINPHLVTITVETNPGGVVNNSVDHNPNTETQTITFKTTGKPN
jgi:hypothetical protein